MNRRQTFAKLKWVPLLNSAARLMALFGGPLFGTGLLALAGFGNTSGAAPLAMTCVGAGLSLLSIAADYFATRVGQDGSFDQVEVLARSTARQLVKALRKTR